MSYFKKIQDWLGNKGLSSSEQSINRFKPVEHKLIERNEEFTNDFNDWLIHDKNTFLQQLRDALIKSRLNENPPPQLTLLNSSGANGFLLDLKNEKEQQFHYLLDYLKLQVLELPYVNYNSDIRIYEKSFGFESTYRHYLKPKFRHDDTFPLDQLYGNILIELSFKNEEVQKFKFLATHYSDSKYQEPKSFEELIDNILK